MTLLLSLVNRQQAILVSDRCLSSNGRVVSKDSNKAGILWCRDGRMAFGYTGLAAYGTFNTEIWLAQSFPAVAAPDFQIRTLLGRFAEKASKDIGALPASKTQKRLSVVFVGYTYEYGVPRARIFRVSNFEGGPGDLPAAEARDEFKMWVWSAHHPPTGCVCIQVLSGSTQAVPEEAASELHDLLHAEKPGHAIVGKALSIMYGAAESPNANNAIGKRGTSLVLPSDPSQSADMEFHADEVCHRIGGVMNIDARGGEFGLVTMILDYMEDLDAAGRPIIQTMPLNDPCWCGCGKKFKRCHGR